MNPFRMRPVSGTPQLLSGAEESERLQHLRADIEKLAVQFSQRIRVLDGNFGRELTTALTRAHCFAPGAAIDIPAAFQFDQITAVAQDDTLLQQCLDQFHIGTSGFNFGTSEAACGDSHESATAEIKASMIPRASRQPMRSCRK